MGPGLYYEIGMKARDLLYRDYHTDQKFSFTTYTDNGVAITGTSTRKDEVVFGEAHFHLKKENFTYDATAVSDKVFTTITVDDLGAPGLKTIFSWVIPDQNSGKVEVQYLHDYAGVNASTGLNAHPLVNLSGVLGTKTAAVGADVLFDTATGSFPKCNVGLSVTDADLVASLTLNNKGDSLSGSYYHLISPLWNTAIGAELTHSFSTNENTLTFGTQHALDPLTTVKARFNNYGKASGLIQHQFRPKSFVTLSAEVDTKAIEKSSKVGMSLALKP